MKTKGMLAIIVAVLSLAGCVSSKEYKARLAELEGCRTDVSGLEAELAAAEKESARLGQELSTLTQRHEELIARLEALAEDKQALEVDHDRLKRRLELTEGELTKEVIALDLRIRELETELSAREGELRTREGELRACEGRIAELSAEQQRVVEEKDLAVSALKDTYEDLVDELKAEIREGEIAIVQLKDKLSLSMVDRILFDSGSAEVKPAGRQVLDRVGAILNKAADRHIRVEGHTDDVPIGPKLMERFPTNWELSTARATNVVRYLQEHAGIGPERLAAAGYSEYRPVVSNETLEGKAKNRRIEIVLIPPEVNRVTEAPPPAE